MKIAPTYPHETKCISINLTLGYGLPDPLNTHKGSIAFFIFFISLNTNLSTHSIFLYEFFGVPYLFL